MATAEQIASWCDGVFAAAEPRGSYERVASPEAADGEAIVFAGSAEAMTAALESHAGLILATAVAAGTCTDPRILRVSDARLAFSEVAAHLRSGGTPGLHATAVVSADASLGADVSVGPGTIIGNGVVIGDGCMIGSRVVLEAGVVLGERVRVQAGAVLGALGFGYARRRDGSYVLFPQQGALVIEDDVEIGANTTIDRGALGETRIGAGTKIDNLVHIAHNCRIGRNVIIAAQTGISGSTVVEDGAILGGQVGIGEHAVVGEGVILGGGAGVLTNKKLYGKGEVFWGRPAQPLKQYLRDIARLRKGK